MAMLDFNVYLKHFDGTDVLDDEEKPVNLSESLATTLERQQRSSNPLKLKAIGRKLAAKQPFEMDRADIEFLKKTIQEDQFLAALVQAEALEILAEAKD